MGPKTTLVLDTECYWDYYLIAFRNTETGNVRFFERTPEQELDTETVRKILSSYRIVTFNGNGYDVLTIALALRGASNETLKKASDAIIRNSMKPWTFEKQFGVRIPKLDHIDLIEVAPGQTSLKIYGGRLHCQKMQDLPIDPDDCVAPEQRPIIRTYCGNDLETTEGLYKFLLPQITLREQMSATYGQDLRSKSDAQIAEAVIKKQIETLTETKVERPDYVPSRFLYRVPSYIEFKTPAMIETLGMVSEAEFVMSDKGKVMMPKQLNNHNIVIGGSTYRMGIGGLHSCESGASHVADGDSMLIDRDVVSYYPAIILGQSLYPKHLGSSFLSVYKAIVDKRLTAKRTGDKVTSDALKITINGSFGKFGSKWSSLFSPDLLIQTTVTGQLALLMLIESLEENGVSVVSANTDGVVMKCDEFQRGVADIVVGDWEQKTGFETEQTIYRALYSRDVNNYIAIKSDGSVKLKGVYTKPGLQKNPQNEICTEAVVNYLRSGASIESTIEQCRDVRKFLTIRKVQGGATKDGVYLGKAIRWYYSIAASGVIQYKLNGYTVPRTEGALPIMELPDEVPADIDLDWYIKEAYSIVEDVGAKS